MTTATPHLMRTGSHRNPLVRGQHKKEAVLFALAGSPLTAIDAGRAAAMIVEASRIGRARIAPGWPARAAQLLQAAAPEAAAALLAALATWVLPGPAPRPAGDRGRQSRDIDTGVLARVFATEAARRYNQRISPDEAAQSSA
ncbi:MAG: hypothetical protein IT184_01105 [Acidobacteria bacterium]|nr:hypothetical protein [Acidobacteriota bacterium]